jgi:hypothetical protein
MAGCSGCVSFVFFIPFTVIGLGVVRQAYREYGRGQTGAALFLGGIGTLFSIIGLCGLGWPLYRLLTRKSANAPMQLQKPVPAGWQKNPWFPDFKNRQLSPRGRVVLRPDASNWAKFSGTLFIAVIWNGITWIGLIAAFRQHKESIGLVLFLGLFGLIGAALLIAAIKQLLRIFMVGETSVEISQEPVAPGTTATLMLYQRGEFMIDQLTITLTAQEVVTYGSGTNSTTHRETVHDETIYTSTSVRATPDHALAQVEFKIPDDAAPSFKSTNNALTWNIQVRMTITGKPDVDQLFPLRIAPEFAQR